jgi:hypothetical protein
MLKKFANIGTKGIQNSDFSNTGCKKSGMIQNVKKLVSGYQMIFALKNNLFLNRCFDAQKLVKM